MKTAFLDRDGVINYDAGYTHRIDDFRFIEGVIEALQLLQKAGFQIIIVTNQSGIGRGYYSENDYQQLTQWYRQQLHHEGVDILDVYHCPHTPNDLCECRKPKPGLLLQALDHHSIDLSQSIMVGDKLSDVAAGQAAGVAQCYLLSSSAERDNNDNYQIANNLLQCVQQYVI